MLEGVEPILFMRKAMCKLGSGPLLCGYGQDSQVEKRKVRPGLPLCGVSSDLSCSGPAL